MRSFLIFILLALFISHPSLAKPSSSLFMNPVAKKMNLEPLETQDLQNNHDLMMQTALLHSILRNSYELAIHQMNGQENNRVFIKETGEEAVFDENGQPVTSCENKGSYNYFHPVKEPFRHFAADIYPWIALGNCREDTTSQEQRIHAYVKDFKLGLNRVVNHGDFTISRDFTIDDPGQAYTIAFLIEVFERSDLPLQEFIQNGGLKNKDLQEQLIKAFEKSLTKVTHEIMMK